MVDHPIEPTKNIPQPIEQKKQLPPEPFPETKNSKISNFKDSLTEKYGFSEKQANLFMQRMEQFIASQVKKEFDRMNKTIKEAFKDDDQ